MNEQDKRAVESLCTCGLDYESICKSFPGFPAEEIKKIYVELRNDETVNSILELKMNCS